MCFSSTGGRDEVGLSIQGSSEVITMVTSDESSPVKGDENLEAQPFCAGKVALSSLCWDDNNHNRHHNH